MSEQEQRRREAREDCTRELIKHEHKHGKYISQEQAQRVVNERADMIDKKKDWK